MSDKLEELKGLLEKITNVHELAGLLSTQNLTQEHPQVALLFVQRAYTLGLSEGRAEQIENENALKMAWFDAGWSQAMESILARAKEYSTTNEMDPSDNEDNMLVSIGELKQICISPTPPQTEGDK